MSIGYLDGRDVPAAADLELARLVGAMAVVAAANVANVQTSKPLGQLLGMYWDPSVEEVDVKFLRD